MVSAGDSGHVAEHNRLLSVASTYYGQGNATASSYYTTITLGSTPITGSETVFVLSAAGVMSVLAPTTDYTISGAVITLVSSLNLGDKVSVRWATTNSTPGGITLGGVSAYITAVLADSPWGFWRLNEASGTTFADISGNTRPLTLTGSATFGQTGPKAKAVTIASGSSNYAASAASHTTSPATLEVWVFISANPGASTGLLGCHIGATNGTGDKDIWMGTDGKIRFYSYDGTAQTLTSPSALSTGSWHHVVGTIGAGGQFLYVDGSQVATSASTSSYTGAAQFVFLHDSSDGGSTIFGDAVQIAEPAFYTTQLSSTRVSAHYSA